MASTFQSLPIFFQSLSARARISSSNPPRSHSSESVSENAPWSICRPFSVAVNTASNTRAGKLSSVCRQEKSSSEPNSIAIACCGRVSCLGYVLSFIIVCAWGRQLYVTTTGGSSGGNLPTPCGQDCASPVILCHTSYVGRGLNLERPRRKANHLRTLHPGHALGAVSKRVGGMIKPRRQTNCSLVQDRASPAQYLPRLLHRARGEFGSYSGGNPLFQKC